MAPCVAWHLEGGRRDAASVFHQLADALGKPCIPPHAEKCTGASPQLTFRKHVVLEETMSSVDFKAQPLIFSAQKPC